jgi:hypothetical protein
MQRDGWINVQWLDCNYASRRTNQPAISEKAFAKSKLTLRVEKYYDPNEQMLCYLADRKGHRMEIGVGSWVDIDQQGRLVFSSKGKLYACTIKKYKIVLRELADFNDSRRSSLKPPAWALHW